MNEEFKTCPQCESPYSYHSKASIYICPECSHEWDSNNQEAIDIILVKDCNGTILQNGDAIIVIKDLPVKGSSSMVKGGTKVKNIRLTDGDHNIDCRIEGFGAMSLKSIFVRKA